MVQALGSPPWRLTSRDTYLFPFPPHFQERKKERSCQECPCPHSDLEPWNKTKKKAVLETVKKPLVSLRYKLWQGIIMNLLLSVSSEMQWCGRPLILANTPSHKVGSWERQNQRHQQCPGSFTESSAPHGSIHLSKNMHLILNSPVHPLSYTSVWSGRWKGKKRQDLCRETHVLASTSHTVPETE